MTRCLVHFRMTPQTGMGHAVRCATIHRLLKSKSNVDVKVLLSRNAESQHFAQAHAMDYRWEDQIQTVLQSFKPQVVLIDINGLEEAWLKQYRRLAYVVNLAPRGLAKYYAHTSFLDLEYADIAMPSQTPDVCIHASGLSHMVVSDGVRRARERIDHGQWRDWDNKELVIAMGGADESGLTEKVLFGLEGLDVSIKLKIILGPLFKTPDLIQATLKAFPNESQLVIAPTSIADAMEGCGWGIFAAGITSYEALSLGIPGIHLGATEFHCARSRLIETMGIGKYGGALSDLRRGSLLPPTKTFSDSTKQLKKMRTKGMLLVDGHGAERVVEFLLKQTTTVVM